MMVLKKLRSVLERIPGEGAQPFEGLTPQPTRPFYAIGDIHGRAGLVEPLLERIDADLETHGVSDPALVFLGDYVDRGEDSAAVLEHVRELSQNMPDNVVCLMGNHERMMLDFLDDPISDGSFWLRHGGMQTLASYGISNISEQSDPDDIVEAAARLSLSLPEGMEDWIRALPLIWSSGNISCVHAAMDPVTPPERQSERSLLWGHPDFCEVPRLDGHWVIHGHTIVDKPISRYGRIAIDTGAWYTGQLSAVAVTGEAPRFL